MVLETAILAITNIKMLIRGITMEVRAILDKISAIIKMEILISNRVLNPNAIFAQVQYMRGIDAQQKMISAGSARFTVTGLRPVIGKLSTMVLTPIGAPKILIPTIFPIISITTGIFIRLTERV